jgi:hypothetical protein
VAGSCEPVRVPQHGQSALVVSGDLLHQVAIAIGLTVGDGERIALRGRQGRVEARRRASRSARTPAQAPFNWNRRMRWDWAH